ncbi:uberolysin/carnocyclin family circular bacteriocin [Paenarthrobacter nicotinovorans]|uniref:uberolysin/carnocyclin family circular bacteriocin n=1 Tax=Paenarthrobacter nicotinovorans TaxID=29320 RepID=UPI0016435D37|nr:uberolysin/carnocyclin family circular bacteriocin [Paenarthrobacter nicotinovorans]
MESAITKRTGILATTAATLAIAGVFGASLAVSWIAGSLGISAAAASQIVRAIELGGWALVAIVAVFGAGITGALIATARSILFRIGRAQAVA